MRLLYYQKGFTIIEFLIALLIIGILISLPIPAYQNYLIRSRVLEGLHAATSTVSTIIIGRNGRITIPFNANGGGRNSCRYVSPHQLPLSGG